MMATHHNKRRRACVATLWMMRWCRNSVIVGFSLAFIGLHCLPAWAQTGASEQQLEKISREIAIEAAGAAVLLFRWPAAQFPLHVAIAAGKPFASSKCPARWHGEFEEFIKFMNVKDTLLIPTEIQSEKLDAFVFLGSTSELEQSHEYALEKKWAGEPRVRIVFSVPNRFNVDTYLNVYGDDKYLRFGATFLGDYSSVELFADNQSCLGLNLAGIERYFSFELLQFLTYEVTRLLQNRFGTGNIEPTLEMRSHRRLLTTMRRLPTETLDDSELKSAFIRALRLEQY